MAIANSTDGIWVNNDGLRIKMTGRAEAALGTAGEYREGLGSHHLTSIDVVYSDVAQGLTDTNVFILDYHNYLPSTAVIDKVVFTTGTAFAAGGDVLLNFGLVRRSDFTTIVDADGIVNSLADDQIDTAGQVTVIDGSTATYAGALMGVQAGIGHDSVICTYWETTAPTSGTGILHIYWRDAAANV